MASLGARAILTPICVRHIDAHGVSDAVLFLAFAESRSHTGSVLDDSGAMAWS